ncbi:uncharacterized protein HaLaN_02773, partial [Haematococcus lacustris]
SGSGSGSAGNAGPNSLLAKLLTGKPRLRASFAAASVGHRHVHLLAETHGLRQACRPGALLAVESGRYMLQLKKEQVEAFNAKILELATTAGWVAAEAELETKLRTPAPHSGSSGMALTEAHLLFQAPQSA